MRSNKGADVYREPPLVQNGETVSKLSCSGFSSMNGSIDSVLVKCVSSNIDFDNISLLSNRPTAPSPQKMLLHNNIAVNEFENNQSHKNVVDYMMTPETERPMSAETYIVDPEDSYLRMRELEMGGDNRSTSDDDVSTVVEKKYRYSLECEQTQKICPNDRPKLESSESAYSMDEGTQETQAKRERPGQANYKTRVPKFTDPLMIEDFDEKDFELLLTDSVDKSGDVEDLVLLNDLKEAIEFILEDVPPPKKSHSVAFSNIKARGKKQNLRSEEDDLECAFENSQERYCTPQSQQKGEELHQISELKTRLISIFGHRKSVNESRSGFVAPPNSPRNARSRPHTARQEIGRFLPSVKASSNQNQSRISHARSEERRVGKECRSRWSPYH